MTAKHGVLQFLTEPFDSSHYLKNMSTRWLLPVNTYHIHLVPIVFAFSNFCAIFFIALYIEDIDTFEPSHSFQETARHIILIHTTGP